MTMTSYGKAETEKLKQNLENQLDRLVEQLQDLENCKKDLDDDEYEETKNETMEQLKELNDSLNKLVKGDISLVSALGAVQLATQAAISQAFKTPEVIRLFGKKDPKQLRERLLIIEEDLRLNTSSLESRDRQKAEILTALRQLDEQLTTEELKFLENHNDISNAFRNVAFVEVCGENPSKAELVLAREIQELQLKKWILSHWVRGNALNTSTISLHIQVITNKPLRVQL